MAGDRVFFVYSAVFEDKNAGIDKTVVFSDFSMVNALGLDAGMGECGYEDVAPENKAYGYLQSAVGYGLIEDGKVFGPDSVLTRAQAMAMLARAMNVTELNPSLSEAEAEALLAGYSDADRIPQSDRAGVAACMQAGVMLDDMTDNIAPDQLLTNAEAAVLLEKFLRKSNLI
ncbi:MAG: S-layer homology domain-containing protein [Firmicutes bacterium]|nr:S-layer homology domain-containing protein [Bacillota bacterium]